MSTKMWMHDFTLPSALTSTSEGILLPRYVISLHSLSSTECIDLNLFNYNHTIQIYVIHPMFPKPIVYVHVVSCTVT